MFGKMNEELQKAQEGMLRYKKIMSMLKELEEQRLALTDKVSKLKEQVEKEDLDVEYLEGKSITHIFYSILGNLDEKLDKERDEALAARLKYDQAYGELGSVEANIASLRLEQEEYKDCERIYSRLYEEKKEQLMSSSSKTGEEILNLSEKITVLKNYNKEIGEAIHAGKKVLNHLESASNSLDSARGWGTWDMFGGGFISDLAKHSHIDEAKDAVSMAQRELSHFRSELADVKLSKNISIEIGDFAKFADFFFDGLIADWHMQSKIKDSSESVNSTKSQVERVVAKLKGMERETLATIASLEQEMNTLITKA